MNIEIISRNLFCFQTVSKIHAEIDASVDGEAAFICDLNSSNKTKLNNVIHAIILLFTNVTFDYPFRHY